MDGIYLFETKTKGEVDQKALQEQLTFDLQTMLYLVALAIKKNGIVMENDVDDWKHDGKWLSLGKTPILGVRYNVVRRPFSGGRGGIKRKEPSKANPRGESKAEFYQRLVDDYVKPEPEYWFMRWKSEVLPEDVKAFRRQFLDPILEQVCEWYDWIRGNPDPFAYIDDPSHRPGMRGIHWKHPYGVSNSINDGYKQDVDEYIKTGSTVGLRRVETLFPEL